MRELLQRFMKYISIFSGIILFPLFLYLIFAIILTIIPINNSFHQDEDGIEIFVHSGTVHTDLVLPIQASTINLAEYFTLNAPIGLDSNYDYIGFGWGDREFYLNTPSWSDVNWFIVIRSLFWPTSTVMHVTFIRGNLVEGTYLRSVKIDSEQYDSLINFIMESFQENENGSPIPLLGKGYASTDRFYEAKGHYNLFYTCNSWTNEGLKKAGVKTAVWAPFVESVTFHLN